MNCKQELADLSHKVKVALCRTINNILKAGIAKKMIKPILLVSILYFVFGKLALLLALPPGYASPIWPSAGIAFAFVLIYGYRVWPGILIGSFFVNIGTSFDPSSLRELIHSTFLPLSISFGAVLQAVGSAFFVRKFLGQTILLHNGKSILRFFLFGGAIGCLIGATFGILNLLIFHSLTLDAVWMNWLTWWVGDAIGVFIFSPMTLAWIAKPQTIWKKRRLSISVPMVIIFILIGILFYQYQSYQTIRLNQLLQLEADNFTDLLNERISKDFDQIRSIKSLFDSSTFVSQKEFETFGRYILDRNKSVKFLGWVPLVDKKDLPSLYQIALNTGYENFKIYQKNEDDERQYDLQSEKVSPLFYLSPFEEYSDLLGLDLLSQDKMKEVMAYSSDRNKLAVCAFPSYRGKEESSKELFAFLPVYQLPKENKGYARENVQGYVFAAIDLEVLILEAYHFLSFPFRDELKAMDVEITYRDDDGNSFTLFQKQQLEGPRKESDYIWTNTISVGQQHWDVVCRLPHHIEIAYRSQILWLIMVGGFLFSSVLGAFILVMTGQLFEVQKAVLEGTKNLRETNDQLKEEIHQKEILNERYQSQTHKLEKQKKAMVSVLEDVEYARREAKNAEEQVKLILESSPNSILMIDQQGSIVMLNKTVEKMFGYLKEELLHQSIDKLVPDKIRKNHHSLRERFFEELKPLHFDVARGIHAQKKNGSLFPVAIFLNPIQMNEINYVLVTVTDITERKKAQEKVIESEEKFRSAFQNAAIGIALVSPEGKWIQVNQSLCKMIGYSEEELLKTDFQSITHPDDLDLDLEFVRQMLRGEIQTYVMEKRYFHKDGSIVWILLSVSLVKNNNGEPLYFISQIQDISQRKAALKKLQDAEELQRFWLNQTTDGLWDWNLETNEVYLSPSLKAELGYEDAEVENTLEAWHRLIHPEDVIKKEEAFKAHIETGKEYDLTLRYRHKKGSVIWVLARGIAIKDEKGKYVRMLGTHNNITMLKKAEEKLRSTTEELMESNKELEQFAYVASHDLQEPVRKIVGFSHLLEQKLGDQLDDSSKEYMNYMVDGAKRMQLLIQDLLQFSRVGQQKLEMEELDFNEIVKEAINNLELIIHERQAEVLYDELPKLKGNRGFMVRLFQNLIGNAMKYTAEDVTPRIQITCEKKKKYYEFSVEDNGIGIKPEYGERIFVIFQRLHARTEYQGTGIGLAICKRMVERHGGKIWLGKKDGPGSVFKFTIPC